MKRQIIIDIRNERLRELYTEFHRTHEDSIREKIKDIYPEAFRVSSFPIFTCTPFAYSTRLGAYDMVIQVEQVGCNIDNHYNQVIFSACILNHPERARRFGCSSADFNEMLFRHCAYMDSEKVPCVEVSAEYYDVDCDGTYTSKTTARFFGYGDANAYIREEISNDTNNSIMLKSIKRTKADLVDIHNNNNRIIFFENNDVVLSQLEELLR